MIGTSKELIKLKELGVLGYMEISKPKAEEQKSKEKSLPTATPESSKNPKDILTLDSAKVHKNEYADFIGRTKRDRIVS